MSMERYRVAVFLHLGAKHMVTGYDHLLFLVGVIFFLYRLKDVGQYVNLSFLDRVSEGSGPGSVNVAKQLDRDNTDRSWHCTAWRCC
jgi:hypothetical protein